MPPKRQSKLNFRRGRRNPKKKGRRVPKPIQLKTHVFVRKCLRRQIALTNTSTFLSESGCTSFSLNDVMNPSDFTNLFDRYKINRIKLTFYWMLNNSSNQAPSATTYGTSQGQLTAPMISIIKNRYDTEHATTQNMFQENSQTVSFRLAPMGKKTYSFKPNILAEAYRTSTSSSYQPKYDVWLDASDHTVPHYGLDIGIDKINTYQGNIAYDVEMCLSMKGCE